VTRKKKKRWWGIGGGKLLRVKGIQFSSFRRTSEERAFLHTGRKKLSFRRKNLRVTGDEISRVGKGNDKTSSIRPLKGPRAVKRGLTMWTSEEHHSSLKI